jgi:hypothetical protein
MIGSRGPRILQTASLVAGLLLAVMHSPMGMFPSSGAAGLMATPTAERDSPLVENATPRPAELPDLDPALDDAWHRYGCHLNPGNPSCLTVGLAIGCAIDATGPGCSSDSDGDRCSDVAEVEAGFDPFDPADCVGSSGGKPAINCLFLTENLACNGGHIADPQVSECTAEREIRQRHNPSGFSGCDGTDQPPDACVYNARDPGCDGFARESG